jgi:hypothetical protein
VKKRELQMNEFLDKILIRDHDISEIKTREDEGQNRNRSQDLA